MIFGRKKRKADEIAEAEPVDEVEEAAETEADEAEEPEERSREEVAAEKLRAAEAKWLEWDEAFDRDEGPFDIEEVDLDADDVKRLDLGSVIITPFTNMNLQITVNKQQVPQAIVASDGSSALEVALFGAPLRSSYVPEVRRDIIAAAGRTKGAKVTVRRGPFGTEIVRATPATTRDGKTGTQLTRTWLAEGPSWVLRGVLFGKAALEPDNEDATITLLEFFANLVVRRGDKPVAAGSVIPFTLPEASAETTTTTAEG